MALEQITFNIGAFNDSDAGGNNYFTNTVFEVKTQSDNTLATIYADASGTTQIPQNGIDNVSDAVGECIFYIGGGDFYIEVNSKKKFFKTGWSSQSRQAIEAIYKAQGYNNVFFFEDGFTYIDPNDVGVYEDGTAWLYADTGALPVTITAGTAPIEGVYSRVDLSDSVKFVGSISELSGVNPVDGGSYYVNGYYVEQDGYGGNWIYDESKPKSYHDGLRFISPTVVWSGLQTAQDDFISGVGETDPTGTGCFVLNEKTSNMIPKMKDFSNLYGFEDKVVTLFAGVDSLTDGAGGNGGRYDDSYFNIVTNSLRAHFGDAGAGWTAFDNRHAAREGMNFSRSLDLSYIKVLDRGVYPSKYSLDFCGLHNESATTSSTCLLGWLGEGNEDRDWDTVELFYLQQPNGATFNAYQTGAGNIPITVNSDGDLSLQSVTINKSLSLNNQIQVDVTAGGAFTVFGLYWRLNVDKGVICSRLALGGYQTAWYANDLDPTFQTDWLSQLNPTHYMLNGGRNDIGVYTPDEFIANVEAYLSRFPDATQKMLISPNESDTDNRTSAGALIRDYRSLAYKLADKSGYAYIDNAEVLGNYIEAVNRGWMLDETHPSRSGNWIIATNVLNYLGVPMYPWTEPSQYIGATGGDPMYTGVVDSRAINGVSAGTSQKMYEINVEGPGTYLADFVVTVRRSSGTGVKASNHKLRVVSSTSPGVQVIGVLTSNEIYNDGSMTESYVVSASINGSGFLQVDVTPDAGNSGEINISIHGNYYGCGEISTGGQRWTVLN